MNTSATLDAAAELLEFDVNEKDAETAIVQVTGDISGTLRPRGSVDGTNFVALPGVSDITGNGIYIFNLAGLSKAQIYCVARASGAAVVTVRTVKGAQTPYPNNVAAVLAAGELHLGEVGGRFASVAVELTRPADTDAYTEGDAVSNSTTVPAILNFANLARVASGSGKIIKARVTSDQAACVAQLRLWLYSKVDPFLNNDNAAHLIKYADRATLLGFIDFPALATEAGSDVAQAQSIALNLAIVAAANKSVYGLLETKTAFTPASAQKFHIELTADLN